MRALDDGDPRTIGRIRLVARIGVGGMAIVYLGRSPGGRAVAVKVMHAEFAEDQEYRDRFLREVAAARTAGGRYSPGVLDAEPDAPLPWLAMEFLPAVSLRDAVRQHGTLPEDVVRSLATGLAEALASIHKAGVLHLDLKPGNVLLTETGPRVIDFGIAGGVRTGGDPRSAGSPGYMSPEQLAGDSIGPASDVFSYGATVAYALTGTPRIDSQDTDLRALITRCLAADPAARPTVAELESQTHDGPVSLPAAVLAEIHRRAREVEGPPAEPPTPEGRVSRRALLLAGGAALLAGGATTILPWAGNEAVHGTARPATPTSATTTTTVPITPINESGTIALEFVVTGQTTLYSLTTTVDGRAETVTNVALPWRRIAEIPGYPQQSNWRIDYHHSAGNFQWQVIVSGFTTASGGSEGNREVHDFEEGTV